jgi:hypothetical protein
MSVQGSNPIGGTINTPIGKPGDLGGSTKSGKGSSGLAVLMEHFLDKENRRRNNIDWAWRSQMNHNLSLKQQAHEAGLTKDVMSHKAGLEHAAAEQAHGHLMTQMREGGIQERLTADQRYKNETGRAEHARDLAVGMAGIAKPGSTVTYGSGENSVAYTTRGAERASTARKPKAPAGQAPEEQTPDTTAKSSGTGAEVGKIAGGAIGAIAGAAIPVLGETGIGEVAGGVIGAKIGEKVGGAVDTKLADSKAKRTAGSATPASTTTSKPAAKPAAKTATTKPAVTASAKTAASKPAATTSTTKPATTKPAAKTTPTKKPPQAK